jgi:hypothetical protein
VEVVQAWATTSTDSEGRFRLFAGDLAESVVILRQGEQELTRVKLGAGTLQRIRLPE